MLPVDLNSLPLELKIGQLFFIGLPGPELDGTAKKLLDHVGPGGVCLFSRNIRNPIGTKRLLLDISKALEVSPFLSLDQEGGLVDRLRRVLEPFPAANLIRRRHEARRLAELIAEAMRILGFNMNFAPVVDVISPDRSHPSNGLYSRAFGGTAEEATDLAGEFLATMTSCGVIGCLKHFPGLGASTIDSHENLPSISVSEAEFENVDLYPYRALLEDNSPFAVMVAHAAYPGLPSQADDAEGRPLPASLNRNFYSVLLRDRLGFDGLTITDDLEMGAIVKAYGIGNACVMAFAAGADMLAICADPNNIMEGYSALFDAVRAGLISESRVDESLTRIAKLKSQIKEPPSFDGERLSELSREIADFKASLNQ